MPKNKANKELRIIRKNILIKFKKEFKAKGFYIDEKNWWIIKKYNGKKELKERLRKTFRYRQWRSDIFTRDDYTCQDCGLKGCYLEAHHLKPLQEILDGYNIKTLEVALNCEELWNINNGLTLCLKCHSKTKKHSNKTKKRISKTRKSKVVKNN